MQIPKKIRKGVVFLSYRDDGGVEHLAGTAFYVSRFIAVEMGFNYLVTARHVIDSIRNTGREHVLMRVNQARGRAVWMRRLSITGHLMLIHPLTSP
jgi:hypothetical protein